MRGPSALGLSLALAACLAGPASAQAAEAVDPPTPEPAVTAMMERLGIASTVGQSPWLVIAGRGAYQYFTTPADQQDRLGWSAHPAVFGTLGVLLLLVGVKDSLLTWLGPAKTPLDVLAEVIHATGFLAGYVYLGDVAFNQPDGPRQAAEVQATATALSLASYLMMCLVHTAVWIVFNSIEVAIILNPFPLVDTGLKAFRTALIGLITAALAIHPALGFLIALPIFLACLVLVPFALRMARVGWVFCWDFLRRWFGSGRLPGRVTAFVSWGLPGVTLVRYGVVDRTEGGLTFTYRRMGFLWRRTVPLPAESYIGIGTLTPLLLVDDGGVARQVLMFPPRYDRREQELAAQLGIARIENVSFGAGVRSVARRLWGRLFGKKAQPGAA